MAGVCAHHIFLKIYSIVPCMNTDQSWNFHQDPFITFWVMLLRNKQTVGGGMRSSYLSQHLINCSLYECWPILKILSRSDHNFSQEVDYKIKQFDALAGVCAHHIFLKISSIVPCMNANLSWKFHQDPFINKKLWMIAFPRQRINLSQNLNNCSLYEC